MEPDSKTEFQRLLARPVLPLMGWWRQWFAVLLGGTVLAGVLPAVLVQVGFGWYSQTFFEERVVLSAETSLPQRALEFGIMSVVSVLINIPGCVLWSSIVFVVCLKGVRREEPWPDVRRTGMLLSIPLCVLNASSWAALYFITGDPSMRQIKALCLFAIPGAVAGIWIAWQAWRAMHTHERAVPRFSLTELMVAVIAWAATLALFAVRR